jgi:hypothetical protein
MAACLIHFCLAVPANRHHRMVDVGPLHGASLLSQIESVFDRGGAATYPVTGDASDKEDLVGGHAHMEQREFYGFRA